MRSKTACAPLKPAHRRNFRPDLAVKFAVEKAVKTILPDVIIKPKRKRYIEIPDLEL